MDSFNKHKEVKLFKSLKDAEFYADTFGRLGNYANKIAPVYQVEIKHKVWAVEENVKVSKDFEMEETGIKAFSTKVQNCIVHQYKNTNGKFCDAKGPIQKLRDFFTPKP